jgi:hypothetical protein
VITLFERRWRSFFYYGFAVACATLLCRPISFAEEEHGFVLARFRLAAAKVCTVVNIGAITGLVGQARQAWL